VAFVKFYTRWSSVVGYDTRKGRGYRVVKIVWTEFWCLLSWTGPWSSRIFPLNIRCVWDVPKQLMMSLFSLGEKGQRCSHCRFDAPCGWNVSKQQLMMSLFSLGEKIRGYTHWYCWRRTERDEVQDAMAPIRGSSRRQSTPYRLLCMSLPSTQHIYASTILYVRSAYLVAVWAREHRIHLLGDWNENISSLSAIPYHAWGATAMVQKPQRTIMHLLHWLFLLLLPNLAVDEAQIDEPEVICSTSSFATASRSLSSTRRGCDCTVTESLNPRLRETSRNLYSPTGQVEERINRRGYKGKKRDGSACEWGIAFMPFPAAGLIRESRSQDT